MRNSFVPWLGLFSLMVICPLHIHSESPSAVEPAPHIASESPNGVLGFFLREGDAWVFYLVEKGGSKRPTGLRVPVDHNPNVDHDTQHTIYASISPDGRKVAYRQWPAWPGKIFVVNIDGTKKRLFVGPTTIAPAHEDLAKQFSWFQDSRHLVYA
ncbi:MAG: hypothetical protein HYV03_00425, partial [Deltaproteobacteria bacterium]|nr:hypothetical protein [Deltaproteobacteria bacterium]